MFNLRMRLFFVVASLLFFAGCQDGMVEVTGSINYEGQVPDDGTIAFVTDKGAGITFGGPYSNGRYKVRVPEGTYRVRITGKRVITLEEPLPGMLGGPPITTRDEKIVPDAYGLYSKLEAEVNKSSRKHDFDLKTPSAKP